MGFLVSRGDKNADSVYFKHRGGKQKAKNKELVSFLPSSDSSRSLGQVQGRIFRDLDGLFHGSQQTLTPLAPQGGAETLWTSDEQLHHHVGIFLHALTWCEDEEKKRRKKKQTNGKENCYYPQKER